MPKLLRGEPVRVVATDLEHNSVIRPFRTLNRLVRKWSSSRWILTQGRPIPINLPIAFPETTLCATITAPMSPVRYSHWRNLVRRRKPAKPFWLMRLRPLDASPLTSKRCRLTCWPSPATSTCLARWARRSLGPRSPQPHAFAIAARAV